MCQCKWNYRKETLYIVLIYWQWLPGGWIGVWVSTNLCHFCQIHWSANIFIQIQNHIVWVLTFSGEVLLCNSTCKLFPSMFVFRGWSTQSYKPYRYVLPRAWIFSCKFCFETLKQGMYNSASLRSWWNLWAGKWWSHHVPFHLQGKLQGKFAPALFDMVFACCPLL